MSKQSDRLRRAREEAGYKSASDAALALDVKYPTYSAHENGSRSFDKTAATRYARKFKVSPAWLLALDDESRRGPVKVNTTHPQDLGSHTVDFSAAKGLPVLGEVAAGTWLEVDTLADPEHPLFTADIPLDTRYPPGSIYGLQVRGTSINRIAEDGDLLVCLSIDGGFAVVDGALVVVERRRAQQGLLEVTAKRVRIMPDGTIELHPESADPRWQSPLRLEHDDEQDIRIIARVEWIISKP